MNLRALKNSNRKPLPVYYTAQQNAWMNALLFKEWYVSKFVPNEKQHLQKLKFP